MNNYRQALSAAGRRIFLAGLQSAAVICLLACSENRQNTYYRDRASISAAEPVITSHIEKKALSLRPYGVRGVETEEEASAPVTSGQEALARLKAGNKRYREGEPLSLSVSPEQRKQSVAGQHPHTAVLGCSDSRVPPEILFDQGPGQLFVVRNAGNVADDVATASLEYAVQHLGVKLLVILGHQSCGAVQAVLQTPSPKKAPSKDLKVLLSLLRQNLKQANPAGGQATLQTAVRTNVDAEVLALLKRSKIIKEAVDKHQLLIARGLYQLESGEVEFWF
jgi:carbonic anhydrase